MILNEDVRASDEVASETFYFQQLYNNGQGASDNYMLFKDGICVGFIALQATFTVGGGITPSATVSEVKQQPTPNAKVEETKTPPAT
jgi:hypothetical protein